VSSVLSLAYLLVSVAQASPKAVDTQHVYSASPTRSAAAWRTVAPKSGSWGSWRSTVAAPF